jgi:hypothetical protein
VDGAGDAAFIAVVPGASDLHRERRPTTEKDAVPSLKGSLSDEFAVRTDDSSERGLDHLNAKR